MSGPPLSLEERRATSIALVFNELATNAAKYGALGNGHGTAAISWGEKEGTVVVTWQERGGPLTEPPSRKGFGNALVEKTIAALGGTLSYDWDPAGLTAAISVPRSVFR